jgi:hypothetical protein
MCVVAGPVQALPPRAVRIAPDPHRAAPFAPTLLPSSSGSPVDCVIVAPDSLADVYQRLADFQTRTGIATVVRGLSTVRTADPRSNDLAQSIRTFLRSAYELWGIRWAILGGDNEEIPLRVVEVTYPDVKEIPTDLYYADFAGDWDGNGNGTYGEVADSLGFDPSISVGRMSASTRAEAAALVDKSLRYSTSTENGPLGKILALAEVLSPPAWNPSLPIGLDGAVQAESLLARTPGYVLSDRYYENNVPYPGSTHLTKAAATAALALPYGVVAHFGHGARSQLSLGSDLISGTELAAIDNGDSATLWIANDCASAAVDFDCVAEQLMRRPHGGALAYVGATRDTWPGNSAALSNRLVELLYADPDLTLGEAVEGARAVLLPAARSNTLARWGYFETVLLGAPTLILRGYPSGSPAVTHPATVPLDAGAFTVHVERDGAPAESARVVAWKADEEYRSAYTDASGDATLPFHPGTTGPFSLSVGGRDMIPFLDSLTVTPASSAHLVLEGAAVHDQLGGDGDGIAGAGETFALSGTVRNSGTGATSGAVSIVLEAVTSGLSIEKGIGGVAALAAGATAPFPDSLRVRALPSPPTARTERLRAILASGAISDTTEVSLEITASSVLLAGVAFSDAVGGDGDGVLEAGETGAFSWTVGNEGSGRARDVTAHLGNPAPGVTILDPDAAVGDVAPGATVATPSMRIQASTVPAGRLFDLTLADVYGHSRTFSIDRAAPGAPSALAVSGSDIDRITLGWTAAGAPDLLGYRIYRALDDGSALQSVTAIPVRPIPSYEDGGLSQLTRYRYQVSAVDSSGNESTPTPILVASTTPPSVPGWPVALGASTSSSACLADLDGDGHPEVIVGAEYLYAFRPDGTDWRDGDQNVVTTGIFATQLHNVPSSPATADLDFDGSLEVIAASWSDSAVAVYDREGALRSGWPRKGDAPFWSSPAIGDLDGDGFPDVVIGSNGSHVYAWHADGTGIRQSDGVYLATSGTVISSPAVADLVGDGHREVIVGTSAGKVYAERFDGELPGWPFTASGTLSASPAIGDIAPGPGLEVAIACANDSVYVILADGTRAPGWPQPLELTPYNGRVNSPVLARLRGHLGDPSLCVVICGVDGHLTAFGPAGNVLPGWDNVHLGALTEASPAVADLDGDGSLEVLIGAEDRRLYAFHYDGTPVSGFPIETGAEVRSTPAVWDLDGDGSTEILVAGWDGKVHAWRYPGVFSQQGMAWPMFHHDNWRTGVAGFPILTAVLPSSEPAPAAPSPPARASLDQNRPNPFNPVTTIGFTVPGTAPLPVRLRVFGVTGRLVRTLVSRTVDPGYHEVRWDGRTDGGRDAASGVYVYRAEIGPAVLQRKLALLR